MILILMMVLIYGVFVKKKSQLLLFQQRKDSLFEQELAISQIEMKEQTLNYIGQELHDDLGQKLSVARLMTSKISSGNEEDIKKISSEINMLIGECIQDIRNLSKLFISNQVKHFGFVESLEREISRIERLQLMDVDYKINNQDLEINSNHALILFRIIQECITNVIKHSKSNKLSIEVEEFLDIITISIHDDGIGFSSNSINDGSGLKNIKNRAQIINADFIIKSTKNLGTQIRITYKKQVTWKE